MAKNKAEKQTPGDPALQEGAGDQQPQSPPKAKNKAEKQTFRVVQEFRDKANFNHVWQKGSDVSHFDQDRLDHLTKNGLVEVVQESDE